MELVEWSIEGAEFSNCNCDWGCPCQFNANPTHGDCRAYVFVQIDRGTFGDVKLDGLRWGLMAVWPRAIHEGNGTMQVFIDERADEAQRAAIEAIAQGRETEPGKLIWQIFSTTMETFKPTLYRPIELEIDMEKRTARGRVPEVLEGSAEPIDSFGGDEGHHAQISLPAGKEFTVAEVVSGTSTALVDMEVSFKETHAHLAHFHWGTHGVVR